MDLWAIKSAIKKNEKSENILLNDKTDIVPIFKTYQTIGSNKINQIIHESYSQVTGRSFRSQWFKLFDWLEYCSEKNVAFCFPCRIFGNRETKEIAFSMTGYSNWKKHWIRVRGFINTNLLCHTVFV
jgi:hypothetical protein